MKTVRFSTFCLRSLPGLFTLRLPFHLCRAGFYAVAPFLWPSKTNAGIRLLDFNPKTRAEFCTKIDIALALIERNDARRFERVKREIRLIVYDRWLVFPLPGGTYFRPAKLCLVNLTRIDFSKSPRFKMAILAALIVSGATIGLLRRRRVAPTKMNKERIAILCRKEEERFLLRSGYDLRQFDPSKECNRNDPQYHERYKAFLDRLS